MEFCLFNRFAYDRHNTTPGLFSPPALLAPPAAAAVLQQDSLRVTQTAVTLGGWGVGGVQQHIVKQATDVPQQPNQLLRAPGQISKPFHPVPGTNSAWVIFLQGSLHRVGALLFVVAFLSRVSLRHATSG